MLSHLFKNAMGIVLALSLSGCLLDRVQAVQQQACDFEQYFSVSNQNGLTVTFNKPVLLYDDLGLIVGIAPRPGKVSSEHVYAAYTLRILSHPIPEVIPVTLKFRKRADELVLSEINVKSPLLNSLDPENREQLAKDSCVTRLPLWRTRVEIPIANIDRSAFEEKHQLLDLVGQPTHYGNSDNELVYLFSLTGADNSQLSGSVTLRYDESGEHLLRTRSEFSHYASGADFERGIAWAGIML